MACRLAWVCQLSKYHQRFEIWQGICHCILPIHKRNDSILSSFGTVEVARGERVESSPQMSLRWQILSKISGPQANACLFYDKHHIFAGTSFSMNTYFLQKHVYSTQTKRIKQWDGICCNCRLCKVFIEDLGFLK